MALLFLMKKSDSIENCRPKIDHIHRCQNLSCWKSPRCDHLPQGESMGDLVMQKLQEKQVVMVKTKRMAQVSMIQWFAGRTQSENSSSTSGVNSWNQNSDGTEDKIVWISMVFRESLLILKLSPVNMDEHSYSTVNSWASWLEPVFCVLDLVRKFCSPDWEASLTEEIGRIESWGSDVTWLKCAKCDATWAMTQNVRLEGSLQVM